jgi:predicted metalloprotease with PDZ domain
LTGVKVSNVLRGGAAEVAGLSPGDELLAVAGWRVRRLEDALRVLAPNVPTRWLVARDQRVLTLTVVLAAETDKAAGAVVLKPAAAPAKTAAAIRKAWLSA